MTDVKFIGIAPLTGDRLYSTNSMVSAVRFIRRFGCNYHSSKGDTITIWV